MKEAINKIDEIRESINLIDVISEYIPLRKAGSNYKALCPFHHEKTPSFIVNPAKQIFHCFGCNIGGNVFTFIMKIENVEFADALKILAKKAGIDIGNESSSKLIKEKEEILKMLEFTTKFYNKNLLESKEGLIAKEYLKKRQINEKEINEFKLGFALNSWDHLLSSAVKNGFTIDSLLKTGLILLRDGQSGYYDRFRNRITFPISDSRNKVLGFGARVLDDSLPKYINSPDTLIYHKGDNLYGWYLSKDEVLKKGYIILVEGYFDCIMCFQKGIKNVCAILGTGLTNNQVELIKRYVDRCVLLFDVDVAGVSASMRSINILVENGISTRIASIPSGKDPDEFLRTNSTEELIDIITNSKDLIEYKLYKNSIKNVDDKVKVVKEILPLLSKIKNMAERAAYITELAEKLKIKEESIWMELSNIAKPGEKTNSVKYFDMDKNQNLSGRQNKVERELLKIMLISGTEISKKVFEELTADDFKNDVYREIAKSISNLVEENKKINVSSIVDVLKNQNLVKIVSELAVEDIGYSHKDSVRDSLELIKVIKKFKLRLRLEFLREEIKKIDQGREVSCEKIEEYNILRKSLQGYNKNILSKTELKDQVTTKEYISI